MSETEYDRIIQGAQYGPKQPCPCGCGKFFVSPIATCQCGTLYESTAKVIEKVPEMLRFIHAIATMPRDPEAKGSGAHINSLISSAGRLSASMRSEGET